MEKKLKCFVIIGYGKKTSYAGGEVRELDLNETYELLIKPVFDELKIDCYRAIDINVSGSIDKVMLDEIQNADIAIADLSTLNANVMWELGVRHALKPHYTLMMCEKKQMAALPFDINHFVIYPYAHSAEGLPFKEVKRFTSELKNVVTKMISREPAAMDSPVHTFLESTLTSGDEEDLDEGDSLLTLIEEAEKLKNAREFLPAIPLLKKAIAAGEKSRIAFRNIMPFLFCRLAVCTYKSGHPDAITALLDAQAIMDQLNPQTSFESEVLGICGAIQKRIYELTKDINALKSALKFYDRGLTLKSDYYNGINVAYCYLLLEKLEPDNREAYTFNRNQAILKTLEAALPLEDKLRKKDDKDLIWVLLTIAEAYHMKSEAATMKVFEEKANEFAASSNQPFALSSYREQKEKIKEILGNQQ
ncbi:MAG: hypothetical protein H7Y31_05080 [Chitinophagaceae bacterium]|nr:hypothetical protein [Chitinophagaceae bacterium]